MGMQLVWTKDIPDFERHMPHTKCIDGTNEEVCVIINFDVLLAYCKAVDKGIFSQN